MGVPLFAREGRGKRLTAAGARLAAKAAGILEGARRLKEDVAGEPEVPRGPVRVGAGEAAIVYFLLPLLRRIREAYPSLALEVRNQRDMESFDQLLAGELDLAVRSREALPHGLRFEPLFASDRMLIVPRGHELAGKKRPTLRDLARHAFVIPPAGSTSRRLIEAAFLRAGLRLEIAMEAGGWEIVKRLVRAGVGVAVVPRFCLEAADLRKLAAIPAGHLFPPDVHGLVTREGTGASSATAAVTRLLEEAGRRVG